MKAGVQEEEVDSKRRREGLCAVWGGLRRAVRVEKINGHPNDTMQNRK